MIKHTRQTLKDTAGSSMIEFSLLMGLLMLFTFSIVDGGYIMYQFNSAQKATQMGARVAATRSPVVTGLNDCGVANINNVFAGTDCSEVPGSDSWSVVCTSSGGAQCDAAARARVLAEMQRVYPSIDDSNLVITFSGVGLGYVGRAVPIPAVTVQLQNIQYNYVAVGQLLNFGTVLNFNTTQTTVIAEDLGEGA